MAMVCQFPVLDQYFEKLMRTRYPEHLPAETSLFDSVANLASPANRRAG
jgi:hypothetical protein